MPVYRGKRIHLNLDYVLYRLRIDDERSRRNPRLVEALRDGIEEVKTLALPSVFYRQERIIRNSPGRLQTDGLVFITGRWVSANLSDAEYIYMGIVTIGRDLEEKAKVIKNRSGLTQSFAMEALGAIALDMGVEDYFAGVEDRLRREGLYPGVPMYPGETAGWALGDQHTIYSALEDELIDVDITEAHILIPKNSMSFIIGLFNHPVKKDNAPHCTYCSMREKCVYRRA